MTLANRITERTQKTNNRGNDMSYDFTMPPTTGPIEDRKIARREMGEAIERMSEETGYKFGPRGWAYYAEGLGLITKGEFSRFEKLLTDMRKAGELDPNVIEPDASRIATEVNDYDAMGDTDPEWWAKYAVEQITPELESWARSYKEYGYWDDLDFYVEMIVEKKDLLQIFGDVAERLNIRITNGKGDTDIHSRLAILQRFKEHEQAGRMCVLLAIGDHDPKGLHIVEGLKKNLMSCVNLKGLDWDYPEFDVVNIGLTEEQILDLGLMKIPNLETGGGKDLSNPNHKDHHKAYVQDYIDQFGVWKCEANSLVSNPEKAVGIFTDSVERYIPRDHLSDMHAKNEPAQELVREKIQEIMKTWTFEA